MIGIRLFLRHVIVQQVGDFGVADSLESETDINVSELKGTSGACP